MGCDTGWYCSGKRQPLAPALLSLWEHKEGWGSPTVSPFNPCFPPNPGNSHPRQSPFFHLPSPCLPCARLSTEVFSDHCSQQEPGSPAFLWRTTKVCPLPFHVTSFALSFKMTAFSIHGGSRARLFLDLWPVLGALAGMTHGLWAEGPFQSWEASGHRNELLLTSPVQQ